jgi:hypothetical protein
VPRSVPPSGKLAGCHLSINRLGTWVLCAYLKEPGALLELRTVDCGVLAESSCQHPQLLVEEVCGRRAGLSQSGQEGQAFCSVCTLLSVVQEPEDGTMGPSVGAQLVDEAIAVLAQARVELGKVSVP